ncbi:hypothetical protein VPH35_018043 [Triticum aestivum]
MSFAFFLSVQASNAFACAYAPLKGCELPLLHRLGRRRATISAAAPSSWPPTSNHLCCCIIAFLTFVRCPGAATVGPCCIPILFPFLRRKRRKDHPVILLGAR